MRLADGWELASTLPGACVGPDAIDGLDWRPATVPGTAAGAIRDLARDYDAEDWWFRLAFACRAPASGERVRLEFDGIATASEVYLQGQAILISVSMWQAHSVDVTDLIGESNQLAIVCRALAPLLRRRRRPAARWRTRVVSDGNLRWQRTMMFGRSPGFAPGPAAVGPWRDVRLTRHAGPRLVSLELRPRVRDDDGIVKVQARIEGAPERAEILAEDGSTATLVPALGGVYAGELRLRGVRRWWPHTHGEPELYELTVALDGVQVACRRVGFRTLSWAPDIAEAGLDLRINEVPVFVRGAVWTPADLVSMAPTADDLRCLLERARDAGMNMLRVVGTGAYESAVFHDLCDELGLLVWQDLMFANLDYPASDPEFAAQVEQEAADVLEALAGRASFAVLCGNSEVEQQPAMLGLDPTLGRHELWNARIPRLLEAAHAEVAYVPSTPCGGALPFHADRGLTHYFGVSGYFHDVDAARRAEVRFAAECLAFANVPDEVGVPVHHPAWKAGVVRDAGSGWDIGAGWDFDDVRDFYLHRLFDVDPVALRRFDHARYLELSRAASGEVMAELIGEWRRRGSPCRGALVLWLKDMTAGAGFGVLDHRGLPKVAYHHLRRAMAPVAVWTTDEAVNGVAVHLANDRNKPLSVRLQVRLFRELETLVGSATEALELPPHATSERTVEGMLGRFVDAAWAYRFGPPGQDAIAVSLESADGALLSQAVRFPAGRPTVREAAAQLGLRASREPEEGGEVLIVRTERLAYGVRVHLPGFTPADDAFTLAPGQERRIAVRATGHAPAAGHLTALNLLDHVTIETPA